MIMGSSEETDRPHDTRLSELFGNKEAFISFLKDCVKADWINDLDEDSLKPSNHSFILQDFKKREADVVYEGTLNNGKEKVIFYVLLENQRKIDFRMPYRLLLYIVEILRYYYNHSDVKARRRKGFKFPAVFPLVFYIGSQEWSVPLNLKEMFYGYERFGGNLINFNYALVDAKGYDGESVKDFRSRLLKVMMMFEKSRGFVEILETVKAYKSEIDKFDDEEIRILSAAVDLFGEIYGQSQNYRLDEILYSKNVKGVDGMLVDIITDAKKYEKSLIKKGKIEGKEEAKVEFAIKEKEFTVKEKEYEDEISRLRAEIAQLKDNKK
jgi:hypothetical protein